MKTIAKIRGINGYKSMSEERLLSVLNESESEKKKVQRTLMMQKLKSSKKILINWEIDFLSQK